jgi:hypothetical protein
MDPRYHQQHTNPGQEEFREYQTLNILEKFGRIRVIHDSINR